VTGSVPGWDTTSANEPLAPGGQGAGYTTGTPDVKWTDQQWSAHPGAVRICQDAGATDDTADELDIETGAATFADAPGWLDRAEDAWSAGKRPGQRRPALYCQLSSTTQLADVLAAAGKTSGIRLHLAHWGIGAPAARALIGTGTGPFIIVAVQWAQNAHWDSDEWGTDWLAARSAKPAPVTTPPAPDWEEVMMAKLPVLKQGDKGAAVRTLQGLLVARHYHLGTTGKAMDGIDGDFGELTDAAVRDLQGAHGLTEDGIAGPDTWPVAAGV